jgi:hypothetical protein
VSVRRVTSPCSIPCTELLVISSLFASVASCALPGAPPAPAVAAPPKHAVAFDDDAKPLPRYHSRRLALWVPLPDGPAWRIDDHSRPELVATHAGTRSRVLIAVFAANELVGRAQCEELARAQKLVPADDLHTLRIVADEVTTTQGTFDTRVEVALEPPAGPEGRLAGHVMAFGGFLRKCYVFVYSTEVDAGADEPVLSSRLAFARARMLGDLELRPFDAVSRDPAVGPTIAPPH